MKILNKLFLILLNSLKRNNFRIMFKKILKRLEFTNNSIEALQWAKNNVNISTDNFCKKIDEALFEKVKKDITEIESKANLQIQNLDINLGGGGNYLLLYFLVRKFKPLNVVETGVAAGWTSLAILKALELNDQGKLYSSDFPLFRLDSPEQYIGILVKDDKLKLRWHLDISGDEISLPKFRNLLDSQKIDLFHYDSDKSYSGREFALKTLEEKFADNCIIIFDDIQNNLHFKDLVERTSAKFTIFEFHGKFVGLIGVQESI